ncbi:hypothetical protein [Nitrospina sp. 32_T5]|uniref:hypothetical protein n=1 Tax=unclassified Nitrospina TaxID=2638683 RepID=UPI003F9AB4AF
MFTTFHPFAGRVLKTSADRPYKQSPLKGRGAFFLDVGMGGDTVECISVFRRNPLLVTSYYLKKKTNTMMISNSGPGSKTRCVLRIWDGYYLLHSGKYWIMHQNTGSSLTSNPVKVVTSFQKAL